MVNWWNTALQLDSTNLSEFDYGVVGFGFKNFAP